MLKRFFQWGRKKPGAEVIVLAEYRRVEVPKADWTDWINELGAGQRAIWTVTAVAPLVPLDLTELGLNQTQSQMALPLRLRFTGKYDKTSVPPPQPRDRLGVIRPPGGFEVVPTVTEDNMSDDYVYIYGLALRKDMKDRYVPKKRNPSKKERPSNG